MLPSAVRPLAGVIFLCRVGYYRVWQACVWEKKLLSLCAQLMWSLRLRREAPPPCSAVSLPLEPGNISSHSHRPAGSVLPGPHMSSGPLVLRLRGPSLQFEAEKPTVLSARSQSVYTNLTVVLGPRETEWGHNWGQGLVGVTIFFQREI